MDVAGGAVKVSVGVELAAQVAAAREVVAELGDLAPCREVLVAVAELEVLLAALDVTAQRVPALEAELERRRVLAVEHSATVATMRAQATARD